MLQVKEFREERGLSSRDMVSVLHETFPGYDKYLHSKVERPDKYGIRLVNEAERLLQDAFVSTHQEVKKRDTRRLPCRVQCRMSKTKLERLQQALKADGFDTVQAGIAYVIDKYLIERGVGYGVDSN